MTLYYLKKCKVLSFITLTELRTSVGHGIYFNRTVHKQGNVASAKPRPPLTSVVCVAKYPLGS